jgi:hypothetical protein
MRADRYKRGANGFVATSVSASILGLYFPEIG